MQKTGPGAKPLPTNKKPNAEYMTPATLAGKKGVALMGVTKPKEVDMTQRQKISETSEKKSLDALNKLSMSDKSLFDKLFEDVMGETDLDLGKGPSDEEALGIEGGEDLGGEGDEVTITLDRATAEKLHSALGALLGGGEEASEEFGEEEDMGGEEFGGEEGEEGSPMGENVSVEPEPKELKANIGHFQKGKYEVGDVKASKGKAETGKIDAMQPEPKALGAKPETLQKHGHQKVASKASQVGKRLFDV